MIRTSFLTTFSLLLALGAFGCGDDDRDDDTGGVDMGDTDGGGECVRTADNETTEELCGDGLDNDCDGNADCLDFGCNGTTVCEMMMECTPTGEENTPEACSDGLNNDCDFGGDGRPFIDCGDFDCTGIGDCGVENSNAACSDGEDNDGDGNIDCDDFDCFMDGVGLNVCSRESTNANCSDGVDNDGDDDVDCDDDSCDREHIVVCGDGAVPAESEWPTLVETACSNGENDDGDTRSGGSDITDCADFDCQNTLETTICHDLPRENTNEFCSDGIDNDGDGEMDCDDFGCAGEQIVVCDEGSRITPRPSDAAITEMANALCSDDMSPDGDTFADCDDFDCTGDPLVTVCNAENTDELCSDGINNDASADDMFADCEDFSCSRNINVTVCEDAAENTTDECTDGVDNDGDGRIDCADFDCEDNDAACGNNEPSP